MKFRSKPVIIEVIPAKTLIYGLIPSWADLPDWVKAAYEKGVLCNFRRSSLTVRTLEGDLIARPDDMIIRGVKGEIYPCKPDIFAATYDPVDEP